MSAPSSKFDAFHIQDIHYKTHHGHAIPASILWPRNAQPGKHPVMVRWHGGGFATGTRLYQDWIGDWTLDLALRHSAVLLMPDHRLMPEAGGLDILHDIHSFMTWLLDPSSLASVLPSAIVPDLNAVLVTGESAGGWLALQCGLHAPQRVRAIIAHYPMLDLRDKHYTGEYEKQIFTPPAPQLDRSILRQHVAQLKGDEVVTSVTPPARQELFMSMLQQGSFGRFFGDEETLYPIEMLAEIGKGGVPPTWILHGKGDSVIPVAGTQRYVEALGRTHPDAAVHLSLRPGEHGFDLEPPVRLEDEWMKEGVGFINRFWPAAE